MLWGREGAWGVFCVSGVVSHWSSVVKNDWKRKGMACRERMNDVRGRGWRECRPTGP